MAYPDALRVDADSPHELLELAARALRDSNRVIVLNGNIALRASPYELVCEVIEPAGEPHRCSEEYKVLIENASRALEASPLAELLPHRRKQWTVVEDDGTSLTEAWRAP